MLTKLRLIKEGYALYHETIVFTEDDSGFTLSDETGNWKIVSITSAAFDFITIPTSDPYAIPLRTGVQVLTPEEYQTEKDSAVSSIEQSLEDSAAANALIPTSSISYTDEEKEFLIDYYGSGYQNNSDKRQWFNITYRFDPVDDDPRNI